MCVGKGKEVHEDGYRWALEEGKGEVLEGRNTLDKRKEILRSYLGRKVGKCRKE